MARAVTRRPSTVQATGTGVDCFQLLKLVVQQVNALTATRICAGCNRGERCRELYVQLQRGCGASNGLCGIRLGPSDQIRS